MLEELQSILHDFDYGRALAWFKKHVSGKFFVKELLDKGEDPYNRKKLIEELRAIEEGMIPKESPLDTLHSTPEVHSSEQRVLSEPVVVTSAPPTLSEALLDEQWKPLYKEANHYFETIGFLPTPEERKEAAFKILDLMDEVERIWDEKEFVRKHGQRPDFPDQGIESLTTAQMVTRINTLRSYISKANKGKLKKERIPEWEAEKAELERRVRG
jgi:hypothetical protein